jgi:methyl-accepting chemotaxis protein
LPFGFKNGIPIRNYFYFGENSMLGLLVGLLVATFISFMLILRKRLEQEKSLRACLAQMAKGNVMPFTKAPTGDLGIACEKLRKEIATSVRWFSATTSSVDALQTEFLDIIEQGERGTDRIAQENRALAKSGELASTSTQEIAGTSQKFSDQIATMSAAIEELSITIQDVSSHVVTVANQGKEASQSANETLRVVEELSEMAKGIGTVVDLIRQIASQTNLLALNATIEAASAGEAGKGFAVVASEVKELARQSGTSAGQIDEKIKNILGKINDVGTRMSRLQNSVLAISEASNNIASTTEEQSVTAKSLAAEISSMNQAGQSLTPQIRSVTDSMSTMASQGKDIEYNCSQLANVTFRNQKGVSRLSLLKTNLHSHAEKYSSDPIFDISAIKAGHMAWYKKLQALVSGAGQLKSEDVVDHHSCALGKWYFGTDSGALRSNRIFQELGQHHEVVHQSAKEVAMAMEQKKFSDAYNHLQRFEEARTKLFTCLDSLYIESTKA